MTSSRKRAWTWPETLIALESFDRKAALAIVEAVGRPATNPDQNTAVKMPWSDMDPEDALTWLLNSLAVSHRRREAEQSRPHPNEVMLHVLRAREACEALMSALIDNENRLLSGISESRLPSNLLEIESSLTEQLKSLRKLQSALIASERVAEMAGRRRRRPVPRGRPRDDAKRMLIGDLKHVYELLWGRKAAMSRDPADGAPGGPFFRFVSAVLEALRPHEQTSEAVASAIKLALSTNGEKGGRSP